MICGDCKKYMKCPNAGTVFTECVYEEQYWQSFRAEAAKDILCAMIQSNYNKNRSGSDVEIAIKYADSLVNQLKEKEEG